MPKNSVRFTLQKWTDSTAKSKGFSPKAKAALHLVQRRFFLLKSEGYKGLRLEATRPKGGPPKPKSRNS